MTNPVNNFLAAYQNGINIIKLKDLLSLKNYFSTDERITTLFPPIEIGSVTLVDQIVLLSLLKVSSPQKILEVGTYLGYTTSILVMNSDAIVYSIDLPEEDCVNKEVDDGKILIDGDINDDFLRQKQSKEGVKYLQYLNDEQMGRVDLIKKDSVTINFRELFGNLDFVFIDGGHSYEIVKSDTENAIASINKGVIIWHDYASEIHSGVTELLNEIQDIKIFHVKNSLCAFSLFGY